MKQLIILTVFILFQVSVFGQSINNTCGTELSQNNYNDIKTTLLARGSIGRTESSMRNIPPIIRNPIRVRLKPHVVRRSDGTGGLSQIDLQVSLQQLRANFVQANIRFEICDVNYIDNDAYFNEIVFRSSEVTMGESNIEINAVNVFFVPNAVLRQNSIYPLNWSYYPISLADNLNWTIMTNSYATDGGTLSHEIGHYFNLIHTHEKRRDRWGNIIGEEHVTRDSLKGCIKNCDTEGDLLCDTPADPDLGGDNGNVWPPIAQRVDINCNYIDKETLVDACGVSYQPDIHNIMSYAYECRTFFSGGQITRMRQAITLDRPEVIANSSYDITITEIIVNEKKAFSASHIINATNIIEATGKAIYVSGYEINLLQGFHAKYGSEFDGVIGNSCIVYTIDPPIKDDLLKKSYKKESYPLQELDVSIYPIPIKDKATIKFNLQSDIENVDIGLYDLAGFMIKKLAKDSSYKKGEHTITLDASGLTPKVYVIIFNTSEGERITKKIIVR